MKFWPLSPLLVAKVVKEYVFLHKSSPDRGTTVVGWPLVVVVEFTPAVSPLLL